VKDWIKATTDKLGPLDGAANIAGIGGQNLMFSRIWEYSSEEYDLVNDVNGKGVFHCLAEQLTPGVMKDGSSVVSIASVPGLKGLDRTAVYTASKHAVVGLTKVAALDAGARGIRVNAIAPGQIVTPMSLGAIERGIRGDIPSAGPLNRPGQPEEISYTVAFLLSDQTRYTTGSVYCVDGGLTI
ncbi:hypothetical protein LTR93_012232, partial [Exophiala xenobiotica]